MTESKMFLDLRYRAPNAKQRTRTFSAIEPAHAGGKQRCACKKAAGGFGTICDFPPPCWAVNNEIRQARPGVGEFFEFQYFKECKAEVC